MATLQEQFLPCCDSALYLHSNLPSECTIGLVLLLRSCPRGLLDINTKTLSTAVRLEDVSVLGCRAFVSTGQDFDSTPAMTLYAGKQPPPSRYLFTLSMEKEHMATTPDGSKMPINHCAAPTPARSAWLDCTNTFRLKVSMQATLPPSKHDQMVEYFAPFSMPRIWMPSNSSADCHHQELSLGDGFDLSKETFACAYGTVTCTKRTLIDLVASFQPLQCLPRSIWTSCPHERWTFRLSCL